MKPNIAHYCPKCGHLVYIQVVDNKTASMPPVCPSCGADLKVPPRLVDMLEEDDEENND